MRSLMLCVLRPAWCFFPAHSVQVKSHLRTLQPALLEGLAYIEIMALNMASLLFGSKRVQGPERWQAILPGGKATLCPRHPHTHCRPKR